MTKSTADCACAVGVVAKFLNCCLAYVFTAVFADRIEADPPAVVASHAD
jgi:hypothetical protein